MTESNTKIIWNNFRMPWSKAKNILSNIIDGKTSYEEISDKITLPDRELKDFRNIIIGKYKEYRDAYKQYELDYRFALFFYEMTRPNSNNSYSISIYEASNNSFWTYVSTVIFPDIVFDRWFNRNQNSISYDHYGQKSVRNYFRTLWWYIHLSWLEDHEHTETIVKNNTTDTILNLVERPGQGYMVELYRLIMKKYVELNTNEKKGQLFRNVLKINNACLVTTNPFLYKDGLNGYVDNLFAIASKCKGA